MAILRRHAARFYQLTPGAAGACMDEISEEKKLIAEELQLMVTLSALT